MKKQIISALALVAIMLPMASASDNREVYFTDLEIDNPQYNQIQWLARSGIIQGYPDGTFQAGNCVNRAEFLKLLYLTTQTDVEATANNPFPDVDQNEWYYPYVISAYNDGVVSGYGDGTFRPAECVTKPEALKMTAEAYYPQYNFEDYDENGEELLYGATNDTWFYKYFEFALPRNLAVYEAEFTELYPITFQGATRGDVAELLWRFQSVQDSDAQNYNADTTAPREIFQEYMGVDEMLTFYFPTQWQVVEDYFYETAGGVRSEMATIVLEFQLDTDVQIGINERQVQCGDSDFTATCLETEIGYTISSFDKSPATLAAMQKIQSTLTYESPEFGM